MNDTGILIAGTAQARIGFTTGNCLDNRLPSYPDVLHSGGGHGCESEAPVPLK